MSTLNVSQLKNASAASPAIVLAADGSATAQISSINGGPLAGMRNRIINGDMRISQRGTSFTALDPGTATYTIDRFFFAGASTGRATITQSTDTPNNTFQNSFKLEVTTADTSVASTDRVGIIQYIEGYNVRDLIGTTFTLSFWVKSDKAGIHCVALRNSNNDRSYVAEYTVNTVNAWEYKTITITGGLITAGTWNWTNGVGLNLCFTLMAGSSFQTTPGSWQSTNAIGTSNQVNFFDATANDFFLCGVQLEPGSVSTPFERRSYGAELALCQRYYARLGSGRNIHLTDYSGTSTVGLGRYIADPQLPVRMRATPSVTASFTGGINPGVSQITPDGCHLFSDGGGCFANDGVIASAEL